jgi:hypothetical protein
VTAPAWIVAWIVAALAPLVFVAWWVIGGERGPERVLLPRDITISTQSVIIAAALMLSGACVLCAWRPVLGLFALAAVLAGIAVFWPIVQQNRYSGPVVAQFRGRHGLHRNDLLAVVPATAAIVAFVWAMHTRRQRAISARSGRRLPIAD